MGRDTEFPLTPELEDNLIRLLRAVNQFRYEYKLPMVVSSGYRPGKYNTAAKGSPNSSHITCEAADFVDTDRSITRFIMDNPAVLERCGLYMEHPKDTPTWVHLTVRRPVSGNRIFNK